MNRQLNLKIDIDSRKVTKYNDLIKVGDTVTLSITLISKGNTVILSGENVKLLLKKEDNKKVEQSVNVSGNTITCTLSVQATTTVGQVVGELTFTGSNTKLTSSSFIFNVEGSVSNEVLEQSKDDVEILNKITDSITKVNNTVEDYKNNINAVAGTTQTVAALTEMKGLLSKAETNNTNLIAANTQAIKNYDALNQLGDATNLAKKVEANTTQLSDIAIHVDEEVNALKYGLKSDGITDNSPLLQKLVDEMHDSGGNIYFPSGKYLFSSSIKFTNGKPIHLRGTNRKVSILKFSCNGIAMDCPGVSLNEFPKVFFDELTIENTYTGDDKDSTGIKFDNCATELGINNCVVLNFTTNVNVISCFTFSINNLMCHGGEIGIRLVQCTDFTIIGGQQSSNTKNIYIAYCYNFNVRTDFSCYGLKSNHGIHVYSCWGGKISGYYEGNPLESGIYIIDSTAITIENIYISRYSIDKPVIIIQGSRNVIVQSMMFSQSDTQGGTAINLKDSINFKISCCSFSNLTTAINIINNVNGKIEYCHSSNNTNFLTFHDNASIRLDLSLDESIINIINNNDYSDAMLRFSCTTDRNFGTNAKRPTGCYVGQTYFNKTNNTLDVFNGSEFISFLPKQ